MKKKQVIRSIMNETSEKKSSTKAAPSNNDKQQAINKGRKGIFSLLFKIQKKRQNSLSSTTNWNVQKKLKIGIFVAII